MARVGRIQRMGKRQRWLVIAAFFFFLLFTMEATSSISILTHWFKSTVLSGRANTLPELEHSETISGEQFSERLAELFSSRDLVVKKTKDNGEPLDASQIQESNGAEISLLSSNHSQGWRAQEAPQLPEDVVGNSGAQSHLAKNLWSLSPGSRAEATELSVDGNRVQDSIDERNSEGASDAEGVKNPVRMSEDDNTREETPQPSGTSEAERAATTGNKEESEADEDSESGLEEEGTADASRAPGVVGEVGGGGGGEKEVGVEEELVQEGSLFHSPVNCNGKYIYMYDLPPQYNQGFLDNCSTIHRSVNMCEAFSHSGAGWPADQPTERSLLPPLPPRGAWYGTDQFNLEIIFHARMKMYPCLTTNPREATLFYIPFYPGLSIFRSLYEKNLAERDRVAIEVVEWLKGTEWWGRHQGRDHLLVITRVMIDFTREVVRNDWGSNMMKHSYMRHVSVLGIEAHPSWAKLSNVHSIPYPTSFHPSTDDHILEWQSFVSSYERKHRIAFAGVGHGFGANLRNLLWKECIAQPGVCNFYDCRNRVCIMKPQNVMWFYLGGVFCLQPPGDTPTRKGLFDSLLAGCIPVVFHEETSKLYKWHLPVNQDEVIIYIPKPTGTTNVTEVFPLLQRMSDAKIARMQKKIISLIPHVAYAMPGNTITKFKDAFSIAIERVLKKVTKLKLDGHPGLSNEDLRSLQ